MRPITDIRDGCLNFFRSFATAPFQWVTLVELILFFIVIYYVLNTLWTNNAKRFVPMYLFPILCMAVITVFSENVDALWFFLTVGLLSAFFLFLFNVELKRDAYNTESSRHRAAPPDKQTQCAEDCINAITKAVFNLSKSNTGALIVLSNGRMPKDVIESGVTLNAAISSQLIEGIFVPKAPLHDGAMLIQGDKIMAAGCFLPLTQNNYHNDFGTRHRAGIGITEAADVSTIIVSEETGIISYVQKKKDQSIPEVTRYIDSMRLKRILKEYYSKELGTEVKK